MLSKPLFLKNIKQNYKLILIFMIILALYLSVIIGMYDPQDMSLMEDLIAMKLSPDLLKAMGFTMTDPSLLGFIASYFYGLLMLAIPMIFTIILANRLVASLVDKGSMAYLLSTPIPRYRIILTQLSSLILAIAVLVSFVTGMGIVFSELWYPGLLDIAGFIRLNLGVLLLHITLSGISFLSSCLANESRISLLFGAGIPIVMLLLQMISNVSDRVSGFKYLTLFTLFDAADFAANHEILLPTLVLSGLSVLLYCASIGCFHKRNLPL